MRVAFFSDIHANLPALEATLAEFDALGVDVVYCLGDLVGYAPWPNEVVETIRRRRIPTLAGNYDEGVGLASDDCGCAYKTDEDRSRGAQSISWTNGVISRENREYLAGLPSHLRIELRTARSKTARPVSVLLVHGSPIRINQYLFEEHPEKSLLRLMRDAHADIMLFGHTHKPFHRILPDSGEGEKRYRHAINIGSVGKPKDGDPRACFVTLDLPPDLSLASAESVRPRFVRVAYDVEAAATAIKKSPLPDAFADMLGKAY